MTEDLLARAAAREQAGRPDQAAALLDEALSGTARLLAARGRLALAGLRAREAMRFLSLAVQLDPADGASEMELALLAREEGEKERALRHWRHLSETRPGLAQPFFETGALRSAAGQYDLAVAAFARIPGPVTDAYWLAEIEGARRSLRAARGGAVSLLGRRRAGGLGEAERVELARLLLRVGRPRAALRVAGGLPSRLLAPLRFEADRRVMSLSEAAALLRARLHDEAPGGAASGAAARGDAASGPADATPRGVSPSGASPGGVPPDGVRAAEGATLDDGAVLVADAYYQAGEPDAALAVLGRADPDALPPAVQELLFRVHAARGDPAACLALAGRMIDARPWDPTPPRLVLGALLEGGALRPVHDARTGLPAGFGRIPPTLFRFWDTPEVPDEVRAVMDTWEDPDGRLRPVLFDDARARAYLGEHHGAAQLRAYDRCHHAAMKSDYVRLCFLVREGGIYLDVDEACADTPEALLRAVSGQELVLVLIGSAAAYANNALIAAVPHHPVLERALSEVTETLCALEPGARPDIWAATGPGLLTRSLVAELREQGAAGCNVALLTNSAWRQLCAARNSLSYKGTAAGNWRMA